jgi:hypothetical protein
MLSIHLAKKIACTTISNSLNIQLSTVVFGIITSIPIPEYSTSYMEHTMQIDCVVQLHYSHTRHLLTRSLQTITDLLSNFNCSVHTRSSNFKFQIWTSI